jgi:plasmid stabilization system protein ParE
VSLEVVFAPDAQPDLLDLYDDIAARVGETRAPGYVERIHASIVISYTIAPPHRATRIAARPITLLHCG